MQLSHQRRGRTSEFELIDSPLIPLEVSAWAAGYMVVACCTLSGRAEWKQIINYDSSLARCGVRLVRTTACAT
jgi:hypothetical protein